MPIINEFLAWWGEQLASLLPESLTRRYPIQLDGVVLVPDLDPDKPEAGVIDLVERRQGKSSKIGRFPSTSEGLRQIQRRVSSVGGQENLMLAVPAERVLTKLLSFPKVVERDLDRVLRYEMDSETPFSVDEVYWDWYVFSRDPAQGKLVARLLLAPKDGLAPLLGVLKRGGLIPKVLLAARPDGKSDYLRLTRQADEKGPAFWRRPRMIWMVAAGLAGLAVVLPFVRHFVEARAVEARIAAVQPVALEAQKLMAERDGTAGGGDVIRQLRARFGDPLLGLAAITDSVPDDSFISDFVMREKRLTISGQSAAATRLISALAGNPHVVNPAFAAPVTRLGSESGGREVFSINAELRKEP